MIIFLRLISLTFVAFCLLFLIGEYAHFLLIPVWVLLISALIICLYFVIKIEMKNLKKDR
ncbi:hypothetical protein PJ311_03560 [Bacillus sp. CLL-7-23]|uniref:Uncharacterized protein n=1 Tax=Bacillus changyiensis TaxID=3004103 RepID=A0ABT4X076_9BACI|nr:hypothetical protein [Bacillus changyiensis]MDA7025689.1 hypothetical protein [Bacillus changyiensis]